MSIYTKLVAETTDQYMAAIDEVQQNFLKSLATFAATVPSQPTLPGWPTVQEVIDVSFAFSQKLLTQQQRFMQKVIATMPSEMSTASAVVFGKTVSPKSKKAN